MQNQTEEKLSQQGELGKGIKGRHHMSLDMGKCFIFKIKVSPFVEKSIRPLSMKTSVDAID